MRPRARSRTTEKTKQERSYSSARVQALLAECRARRAHRTDKRAAAPAIIRVAACLAGPGLTHGGAKVRVASASRSPAAPRYPAPPWGGGQGGEDGLHGEGVLHDGHDAQPAATAGTGEDIEVEGRHVILHLLLVMRRDRRKP
jgi:hypothetical protein